MNEYIVDKRDDLPKMIDDLVLKRGVEIGVCTADFSSHLLDNSKLDILYGVDAWSADEKLTMSSLKRCDKVPGKFENHYEIAKEKLSKYGDRSKIIRGLSFEVADQFEDDSLDFIYVDASHRFSGVALDLIKWYPKLRYGGVMAGHDYWIKYRDEVMAAVNGFVVEKEQILNITALERKFPVYPPTWYFVKRNWSKADYFSALDNHIPKIAATKSFLKERKVLVHLPYEYQERWSSLSSNESFIYSFVDEINRLNSSES